MKKLVIVESPAKAKTIGKILGKEFVVKASVGHVRDLPEHTLGVDVKNEFAPKYVVPANKKKVIDELTKAAKDINEIYLAPDPDREGESIAWHLQEILKGKSKKNPKTFYRIQYNEITPTAVRHAVENPGDINMQRVDAQQARRILDRIVGYKVSPFLWRRIEKGLSAGRVQSVALRLVCEREDEVQKFVPVPYWLFDASVKKRVDPQTPFTVKLRKIDGKKADINTPELADSVRAALAQSTFTVADITERTVMRRPYAPFITSTLQQAASNVLGYSPATTMGLAQSLYEGVALDGEGPVGLITYMRTDSFNIAAEARVAAGEFITEKFGAEYFVDKPRSFKNRKSAQGAHEAIRPTDPKRTPESLAHKLKPQELKLYDLIWKRFMASQMTDAKFNLTTATINATPEDNAMALTFSASASRLDFPGYIKVTGETKQPQNDETNDENDDTLDALPPLEKGETLDVVKLTDERKETKPPPRYNEASLVKALESNGVGRPSTYASIIATLTNRKYVNKEKRNLIPTELGQKINAFLVENFETLFNVAFTAEMESELDEVEDSKEDWHAMLARFYKKFTATMKAAQAPSANADVTTEVLAALEQIERWAPPTKRGKRTYSDEKFVQSLREQFYGKPEEIPDGSAASEEGAGVAESGDVPESVGATPVSPAETDDDDEDSATSGAITENQLEALLKIMCRYKDQVPNTEELLKKIGREAMLDDESLRPPRETTKRKLELLEKAGIAPESERFVNSLKQQVESGRRLSERQIAVLNDIFLNASDKIEGFSPEMCAELGIEFKEKDPYADARTSDILAALAHVATWNEPVKRGKRVFDDSAFYKSVADQFNKRGSLSPAQIGVVERMMIKYKAQIPNFDELSEKYDIKSKKAPQKDS